MNRRETLEQAIQAILDHYEMQVASEERFLRSALNNNENCDAEPVEDIAEEYGEPELWPEYIGNDNIDISWIAPDVTFFSLMDELNNYGLQEHLNNELNKLQEHINRHIRNYIEKIGG
ncbi:hypothetical protein [Alteromonas sp. A079]|uniref:hypothetical protein n=1 Tax=Alteromonas sp. A079 TaxID=3410268 RepID=UPI003BA25443